MVASDIPLSHTTCASVPFTTRHTLCERNISGKARITLNSQADIPTLYNRHFVIDVLPIGKLFIQHLLCDSIDLSPTLGILSANKISDLLWDWGGLLPSPAKIMFGIDPKMSQKSQMYTINGFWSSKGNMWVKSIKVGNYDLFSSGNRLVYA